MTTLTSANLLSKVGAHLRRLLESQGIDAESVGVTIAVRSETDKSLMISAMLRGYDSAVMRRFDNASDITIVHGVPIRVIVQQPQRSMVD